MDFYELAAKLLMSAQGRGDGRPVPAIYGEPTITDGEATAAYLESLYLIKNRVEFAENSWIKFNFLAFLSPDGKALIGRLGGEVDRIAEHFRQQDNPPSSAIDQSTHNHISVNGDGNTVTQNSHNNPEVAELFEKIAQTLREGTPLPEDERKSFLEGLKEVAAKVGLSAVTAILTDALSNLPLG